MAFLKTIWKANSKHKKLSEEQTLQSAKEAETDIIESVDTENDVVTFKLKYLGSTVVEKTKPNESISAEAVKAVLKAGKAAKKKLVQRVNLAISLKGIAVTDLQGNDILKVSIYRISNCASDATHRQVFSFVATDDNEQMECHAFLCAKRKVAETVTLAVAHAFGSAYEAWRIQPSAREFEKKTLSNAVVPIEEETAMLKHSEEINNFKNQLMADVEVKLIDFDEDPTLEEFSFDFSKPPCESKVNTHWVCFEDDFVNETQRNGINLVMA